MTDAERYRAAWRKRKLRTWALAAMIMALLIGLRLADGNLALSAACVAGIAAAVVWFYRFRCPRCDAPFVRNWVVDLMEATSRKSRCQKCGLELNQIPP